MAYTTSKTDWNEDYEPSPTDMNRIEGNIKNLKTEDTTIEGDKTFTGSSTFDGSATFNNGATADSVTADDIQSTGDITAADTLIATNINTGAGTVKCYAMDQPVRQVDSPTFLGLTVIGALIADGSIVPGTSNDLQTVNLVTAGGTYTPPRSTYNVYVTGTAAGGGSLNLFIEINIASTWVAIASTTISPLGTGSVVYAGVFTTGSNLRVRYSGSVSSATAYFDRI